MIRQSPIKKTTQLTLNCVPLREIVITLDEQNEESLIGGSFTGGDTLRPRLTSSDAPSKTLGSYYGIRSIPTLM
jgi:hypothetical protein